MDFLELFNAVAKVVKPMDFVPVESKDKLFRETNIDSLDMLMITVYMCELFGISEEIGKGLKPTNVTEIETFVTQHATKRPASVQEAVESIS